MKKRAYDEQLQERSEQSRVACLGNSCSVEIQARAEPVLRRALEGFERELGSEHPDTLGILNQLAMSLYSKGDYARAEPVLRRALEVRERVLGPEHPDTLESVNNLAMSLYSKGDYACAEPLFRRALEVRERVLGPEHPDTLTSVNNLAGLLYSKKDYVGAEPLCRRVVVGLCRISSQIGRAHPDIQTYIDNYSSCLGAIGMMEAQIRQKIEVLLKPYGLSLE